MTNGTDILPLSAPFPWFGGKSRAAKLIWSRMGDVPNWVEPFAGSLAVMLNRPHKPRAETVNDLDCYVSNFWRALSAGPEELAFHADWPVNEADLHARHLWLVQRKEFRERMLTDPHFFDVKIAGWWVWGLCQWIGGGWCADREKPWRERPQLKNNMGVHKSLQTIKKMPHLDRGGTGVHRKRPVLGRGGRGVATLKKRPILKMGLPGVHKNSLVRTKRQMPSLGGEGSGSGRGVLRWGVADHGGLVDWFYELADRLRRVRVCCGDWSRILGATPTTHIGLTGVLLDPPYGEAADRYMRGDGIYAKEDLKVAFAAGKWAVENGQNPKLRIALCGLEGEHQMPSDWECVAWLGAGGYSRGANNNRERERIWFSPHCLKPNEERTGLLL